MRGRILRGRRRRRAEFAIVVGKKEREETLSLCSPPSVEIFPKIFPQKKSSPLFSSAEPSLRLLRCVVDGPLGSRLDVPDGAPRGGLGVLRRGLGRRRRVVGLRLEKAPALADLLLGGLLGVLDSGGGLLLEAEPALFDVGFGLLDQPVDGFFCCLCSGRKKVSV